MKAWHFTKDTLRDGRPLPPNGEILIHEGEIEICKSGLHASTRLLDALQYAPGSTICRVECGDIEGKHADKFVCRERTILWRIDGEVVLRRFARKCALDVAHLWEMPDTVREYLETGDESLREAALSAALSAVESAARSAALSAVESAVESAARSAARSAVESAVESAARSAARSAAWSAARSAAWSATRAKQNRKLTAMVIAEHKRNNK